VGRLRRHAGQALTRAALLLFNFLQGSKLMPGLLRWGLLRLWGIRSATRRISDGCWFGGRDITIGRRTFVNFGCVFDNLGPIRVGDDCDLGMEVLIATSTHAVAGTDRRAGALSGRPVEIGDGCWIGARAILLPGVTVGSGCIVGAGAVVTRDCEPNGLYAGNPARRLRELS
jgi:maltose O-acetyltransferase